MSEEVLYEDEKIKAFVPEKTFCKGHIIIEPKTDVESVQEMEEKDFLHLIYGSSFASTALFENLQAHGTNIILGTGGPLKKGGELKAHAIARWQDDGKKLLWTPKKIDDGEMTEVAGKIKDKMDMQGVASEKEVVDLDKKPEKIESSKKAVEEKYKEKVEKTVSEEKKTEEDESYLVKQLRRIP
ncbi:HIT family protein [Nanoarchaeota archaeon]